MSYQNPFPLSGTATPHQFGPESNTTPSNTTAQPTKRRQRERPKIHPCPWKGCDRFFSCQHNVDQHIREAHTFERPYKCELCGAGFARPYSLTRHQQVHGIQKSEGERRRQKTQETEAPQRSLASASSRNGSPAVGYGANAGANDPNQINFDPQPNVTLEPGSYAIGNFNFNPTTCRLCSDIFNNREEVLTHNHVKHDFPQSCHCNCKSCLKIFGTAKLNGNLEETQGFAGLDDEIMQQLPSNQFGDWDISTNGMNPMNDIFSPGNDFGLTDDELAKSLGMDWMAADFSDGANNAVDIATNKQPAAPANPTIPASFTANMFGTKRFRHEPTPRGTIATNSAIPPNFTANMDGPKSTSTTAQTGPFATAAEYERFTQNMNVQSSEQSGAPKTTVVANQQDQSMFTQHIDARPPGSLGPPQSTAVIYHRDQSMFTQNTGIQPPKSLGAPQSTYQQDQDMFEMMDFENGVPGEAWDGFGDRALDPQPDQVRMAESEEIMNRL